MSFFMFSGSGGSGRAKLRITGAIGAQFERGVSTASFRAQLAAITEPVLDVEIHSPGGDVFTAIAIYNMLRASGKTIAMRVGGYAASAGSLILMAGDTIEMPSDTFLMVHNAAGSEGRRGTAEDHRAAADMLEKIGNAITDIYVARTGIDRSRMLKLLAEDTWLSADEALALGFATSVTAPIEATASLASARAKLPAPVVAVIDMTAPHLAAVLNDSPQRRTATRDAEIKALCGFANRSQDAGAFISAGTPLPEVRAALLSGGDTPHLHSATLDIWAKRRTHHRGMK